MRLISASRFRSSYCAIKPADVNMDGVVNVLDLAALAGAYGQAAAKIRRRPGGATAELVGRLPPDPRNVTIFARRPARGCRRTF
ncbi:MAG: hypothetical protein KGK07_08215 [Chloroflexota bacterium]|nr:hypothetical protein [Chloroflexota bacterium]